MSSRPLSPHLQVYRWQITMVLSILHRATGVALAVGFIALTWWFVAAASSTEYFAFVNGFITSWLGKLCVLGFTFSAWYHLCNGVRHLAWDMGFGFDIPVLTKTGFGVVIVATLLTLLTLFI